MRPRRKLVRTKLPLERLKSLLESAPEVRQALDKLEAAGAHRNMVLNILAAELRQKQVPRWSHDPQGQKRNLRSLARRIGGLADEIERFYGRMEDTIVRVYPESGIREVIHAPIHPDLRDAARLQLNTLALRPVLDGMRACASDLEEKASIMGQIAKLARPSRKRVFLAMLLSYLQGETGNARKHLGTVSEMLNAAFYEPGIEPTVTTDSLEKLLTRHVIPKGR